MNLLSYILVLHLLPRCIIQVSFVLQLYCTLYVVSPCIVHSHVLPFYSTLFIRLAIELLTVNFSCLCILHLSYSCVIYFSFVLPLCCICFIVSPCRNVHLPCHVLTLYIRLFNCNAIYYTVFNTSIHLLFQCIL